MNQQQKKYAMERLSSIFRQRKAAIKKKHTTPAVVKSAKERAAMFKRGEFTVKSGVKAISSYTDVEDIVTFKGEREQSQNDTAIEKEVSALWAEYNEACDELMLGDEEKALQLIKAFDR